MGRRNLPCSTVNAHTENSTGARSRSSSNASSMVTESLPPESATATRSPSRIILNRATASPTLRRSVFSRSTSHYKWHGTTDCGAGCQPAEGFQPASPRLSNMPSFRVQTPQRSYDAIVERGSIARTAEFLPPHCGIIFVVTARDVWNLHGTPISTALSAHPHRVLFFPGGEARKRMAEVESLAEQMIDAGGDRSSVVIAF